MHFAGKSNVVDMVLTSETTGLSIAYLRNLHAHCDIHRPETLSERTIAPRHHVALISPLSANVATTLQGSGAAAEASGNVWSVPAQSVILPLQASLSPRSEDEQLHSELTENDSSLRRLSHHLLDV